MSMNDILINNRISLLTSVQKPLGIHHIRTKLYSIPLSKLSLLFQDAKNTSVTDSRSVLYRLVAIIMDIANHRLFKPDRLHPIVRKSVTFLR